MANNDKPKILGAADLVHLNRGQRVGMLGGNADWHTRRVFLKSLLGPAALFLVPAPFALGCSSTTRGSGDGSGGEGGGGSDCPVGAIVAKPDNNSVLTTYTGVSINVVLDMPMDVETVKAAFSISPAPPEGYAVNAMNIDGPYCSAWVTCQNPTEQDFDVTLAPNTLYTVTLANTAIGLNGECFGGITYSFTTGSTSCTCQSDSGCPSNTSCTTQCSCQGNTCGCQGYACGCQSHSGCSFEGCTLYRV
jgi:hypothetical protein